MVKKGLMFALFSVPKWNLINAILGRLREVTATHGRQTRKATPRPSNGRETRKEQSGIKVNGKIGKLT